MASGSTDLLADPEDVKILEDLMKKSGLENYEFKEYEWGHLGFVISDNLKVLIDDVMAFVEKWIKHNINK